MINPRPAGPQELPGLTPHQDALVRTWLPGAELVADMSWEIGLTTVLQLRSPAGDRAVIKAGGAVTRHHIAREVAAGELLAHARAEARAEAPGPDPLPDLPHLLAHDVEHHLLALTYRPGVLLASFGANSPAQLRDLGRRVAQLHGLAPPRAGADYLAERERVIRDNVAAAEGLLEPALWRGAARAAALLVSNPREEVVPTHGDVTARNALATPRGGIALIDLGRFAWRPWYSDAVRLHHQYFHDPERSAAFLEGLGRGVPWLSDDGATRQGWAAENLRQALTTVVWATKVGDLPFAAQGRTMLERTLANWPTG